MRRRLICGLILLAVLLTPIAAWAQSGPLVVDSSELTLTGMLDQGAMTTSLRLMPQETLTGVRLFASDLVDATGDGRTRDPIPAGSVTLLPAAQFEELAADSVTQVVVQVSPPAEAGTYTGALTIRWSAPSQGELTVPLTVVARIQPNLVILDPSQVVVSEDRGQRVTRRVILRETAGGSPLTGLAAIPQDLRTANGEHILPATRVSLALPADQLEGGELLTAELAVDLQGVPAGAYSGQVHLVADDGNVVALPVTVNIRHSLFLPVLVLIVGAVLGIGLSTYRDRGRPRDKLILRMSAIRRAMTDDDELEASFGPRLKRILSDVEAHLREERWEEAKKAVAQAEGMVRKWEGEAREEWIRQLIYLKENLLPRLEGEAWTLRKLRQQAEDVRNGAADFKDPAELRDRLFDIERELERYEVLRDRLEHIGTLRVDAPASYELRGSWLKRECELEQRLNRLLPDDKGWDQLEQDIEALTQEVEEAIATSPLEAKGKSRGIGEGVLSRLPIELRLPEVRTFSITTEQAARWRLELEEGLKYGLGFMISVLTGLSTLYFANLIFGAEPVSDYLALLAWGLGVQTTFASAVELLRVRGGMSLNQ